ncbi:MAG: hypothetical protein ACRCXC_07955 [Legionella sp.]
MHSFSVLQELASPRKPSKELVRRSPGMTSSSSLKEDTTEASQSSSQELKITGKKTSKESFFKELQTRVSQSQGSTSAEQDMSLK